MEVGKFRDGLLGINMMLVVSKNGWKWIWERKLAKGHKTNLAEVILCFKVLGKKGAAAMVGVLKDGSEKLRSWTSVTLERKTKCFSDESKMFFLGGKLVFRD